VSPTLHVTESPNIYSPQFILAVGAAIKFFRVQPLRCDLTSSRDDLHLDENFVKPIETEMIGLNVDSWVLSDSRPAVSIPGATGGWYRAFFACPWDWLPLSRYPLVFLDLSPSLAYWFGSVPHRPTLRNIPAAPNTHVHLYASVISWDQLGKNMAADVPRYPSSTSAITLHSWLL